MASSAFGPSGMAGHQRRRSSRVVTSPKLDTTISVLPSPVLGGRTTRASSDASSSAYSPRLTATPRLASVSSTRSGLRKAKDPERSPRAGFEASAPRRRRKAATVKPLERRVAWRDVVSHYGRSPRAWAAVAVVLLMVVVVASARGQSQPTRRRGKWAHPDPDLPTTPSDRSARMLDYVWQQTAAVRQRLPQVLPSPPRLFGLGKARPVPSGPMGDAPQTHLYHSNGLLFVNPKGRHPIHSLMERAEREWRTKLHSQSRTLAEAQRTYHRRYKRNPPAGFDKWWHWAAERDIILVDEHDQIGRDVAPFFAVEPDDLRQRNRAMQERGHTFIIAIDLRDGSVSAHGEWSHIERARDVKDTIERFSKHLPGVGSADRREGRGIDWLNLTIIVDDQPAVLMSYEHRARMKELAEQGEYFSVSEWVDPVDNDLSNYGRACPPDSPLRRSERKLAPHKNAPPSDRRSFIYDHAAAMDLCKHPEIRGLHGFTSGVGVGVGPLVPLFTFAKMPLHTDMLITPLEQYADDYVGNDVPWAEKQKAKLLWRGSTTGAEFRTGYAWRDSQRARLHYQSHSKEGERSVLLSELGRPTEFNASMAELNAFYMDTSFAGTPLQCDDETCEIMRKEIDFAPTQGLDDSYQYKYLIDVDGNGWSGRFHRLMSTKSMVLKSSVFPEWYMDRIQPWLHYVPVKVDYSDLYDIMAFFAGSPDGRGGHDALGERIATAGKQWAKDHWRRDDMASYMFRLCLEHLRLLDRGLGVETDYNPSHGR